MLTFRLIDHKALCRFKLRHDRANTEIHLVTELDSLIWYRPIHRFLQQRSKSDLWNGYGCGVITVYRLRAISL